MLFRSLSDQVEVSAGDVLCPQALSETRKGVDFSFYLIHSKSKGSNFHELDIQAARAFSQAARQTRFKRFFYLGALGDPEASLSRQLHSRQETGQALRDSGVPFAVFRAAVIVGLSSTSFVMIRYLGESLPILVCPRWIHSRIQSIAVNDFLKYKVSSLSIPKSLGLTIENGGKDVTTC